MPHRKIVVLKIGGKALEPAGESTASAVSTPAMKAPAEDALASLAADLGALDTPVVIVHGGGAEVTAWCERLGVAPRFVDGLRVTDPPALEVATAVLAGLANKRLVARLRATGIDAVGLSALDGGTIEAIPHPRAHALGAVGAVSGVQPALLETLIDQGRVPVIASICDHGGALLNVNADDLAAALAGALHARALVLLSDAPGLVIGGAVAARLDPDALPEAIEHPEVKGGMRPKLIAARAALEAGVPRVHIAAWRGPGTLSAILGGAGGGTTVATAANVERSLLAGGGAAASAGPAAHISTSTAGVRND